MFIPSNLRKLQRPWFPKGIDHKAERIIRFGGHVREDTDGLCKSIEWMSGGAGTVMTDVVSPETAESFRQHANGQYFDLVDENQSRKMIFKLHGFLSDRGVQLIFSRGRMPKMNHHVLFEMLQILSILPSSHFGHTHFKRMQLGGWGRGAAKCSEYDDPVVKLFDFVLQGPLRNLHALMLHEIGHSFYADLPPHYALALDKARKRIVELQASYGVDFLLGPESRQSSFLFSTKEFTAETYMMYVTQGAFTPEGLAHIEDAWKVAKPDMLSRHHDFLGSIDQQAAKIWRAIWKLYRKRFEGIEYV